MTAAYRPQHAQQGNPPAWNNVARLWRLTDSDNGLLFLWIAHTVAALAMRQSAMLSTLVAVSTMLFALWLALTGRRSIDVAYVCAYIAGAEVLWRMTHTRTPYEGAKYIVAVCCLGALGRMGRKHLPGSALFYLLLLLPGALLSFLDFGLKPFVRKMVSFNMSGPIALAIAICFFSNLIMTRQQLWRMLLLFVTPIVGIASITLVSTHVEEEQINFGTESNKATSGGFGPNQVSAILGLGAAILILYLIKEPLTWRRKLMVLGAVLVFMIQSAMTFSRGGLYAAFGALLPAMFLLMRDPKVRARVVSLFLTIALVATLVIVPFLVRFTNGAIAKRFQETRLSGREEILESDLQIWLENPIYGVGVGVSNFSHAKTAASHNEFTRMLADHGVFGLTGIGCLLLLAARRVLLARGLYEKAFIIAMFIWSFLFLGANGFRIAAPAFTFAITCMQLRLTPLPVFQRRFRQQPAHLS